VSAITAVVKVNGAVQAGWDVHLVQYDTGGAPAAGQLLTSDAAGLVTFNFVPSGAKAYFLIALPPADQAEVGGQKYHAKIIDFMPPTV